MRMGLAVLSISVRLLLLMALAGLVQSLRFDLSGVAPKCLAEEIQANVLVLANYQVIGDDANRRISAKVTSPYGNVLHSAENVESSQFGFTTSETGNYMACFWIGVSPPDNPVLSVELDWKIGVAARDWDSVARKDKIEGIELELMKLQGAVEAIHENLVYMREREKEMRNVSEFTNTKVAWFGITSLMICLAVAGWQLWHLKSYFERKKLI